MKWLDRLYHKFLWFTGFREGEHISDMLARQKGRLGPGWWTLPALTFLFVLGLLAFLVWLTIHIATYKLKNK
jgi:hypothetical protein